MSQIEFDFEDKKEEPMKLYTSSGVSINVANPEMNELDNFTFNDMSKVAFLARYGGLTCKFYSVASHSIIMSDILSFFDPCLSDIALIHDLTEVYYADMPFPVKSLFPEYEDLEKRCFAMICKKFNINYNFLDRIKPLDRCMWTLESPVLQRQSYFVDTYRSWCEHDLNIALNKINPSFVFTKHMSNVLESRVQDMMMGGSEKISQNTNEMRNRLLCMYERRNKK